MTTHLKVAGRALGRFGRRTGPVLGAGGVTSAFMLWLGTTHTALILKNATGLGSSSGKIGGGGTDLFYVINHLLGPMLIIVVAIAPLAIAWGAAMMIFDGRHGPQVMASAVIAVVLVGAAKGIAV